MNKQAEPLISQGHPQSKVPVLPSEIALHNRLAWVLVGPERTNIKCPHCAKRITTYVRYTSNTRTYIAAAICCLVCCCCIPILMESAKNADHYCPDCRQYIGTYHR